MDLFFEYFNTYGIYIIYLFIILEYSCIPLPSEVILPFAGAYALVNSLNVFIVILVSTLCGLIGSIICYFLGLFGYKIFLKNQKSKFKNVIETFNKYGKLSILFGRVIPLCRTYISIIAGLNKTKFLIFLFYSTIGILIWNTILILLGYNFFNNLDIITLIYQKYSIIIITVLLFLFISYIIKKIIKKKRKTYEASQN